VIGFVLIGAVQEVAVEEKRIARLHFDVFKRHPFQDLVNAFAICTGLIARKHMIDAPAQMRAGDDL
jgi:hypothetical protein